MGWPALAVAPDRSALPNGAQADRELTVMTRNIYLGAELGPIFEAETADQLVAATTAVWQQVLATNFGERAQALADEVTATQPLLIGLQEVSLWRTQTPSDPTTPAEEVAFDFLDILLDALAERGVRYTPVSISEAFDGELPAFGPAGLFDVRLTDRDVVLIRSDVPAAARLKVVREQHGLFDAALSLPVLGESLRVDRGWNAVDVKFRGRTVRFVNTHLEAFDPGEIIRIQQAQELIDGPLATNLPVVLVGDINSPATEGLAYQKLLGSGLIDTWSAARPGEPGLTCCQAADLRNDVSTLSSRIDVIFASEGFAAVAAEVVGDEPEDRTPSGLWPSDHAGVVATLVLPRPWRGDKRSQSFQFMP
jgi:endonuclease/exonuclease/phosphatase family metal-dependent hydrolase